MRAGWGEKKQGRVGNYESGKRVPDQESASDIAGAFGVPVTDITPLSPVGNLKLSLVPLIEWSSVGMRASKKPTLIQWASLSKASATAVITKLPTDYDKSMEPVFNADSLLLVDPAVKPRDGHYVICVINGKRRLRLLANKKLKTLRTSDRAVTYHPTATPILAVVISSAQDHL